MSMPDVTDSRLIVEKCYCPSLNLHNQNVGLISLYFIDCFPPFDGLWHKHKNVPAETPYIIFPPVTVWQQTGASSWRTRTCTCSTPFLVAMGRPPFSVQHQVRQYLHLLWVLHPLDVWACLGLAGCNNQGAAVLQLDCLQPPRAHVPASFNCHSTLDV